MIKQSCESKPKTSEEDFTLTPNQGKFDSDYGSLIVQTPELGQLTGSETFTQHLSYSFPKQPSHNEPNMRNNAY